MNSRLHGIICLHQRHDRELPRRTQDSRRSRGKRHRGLWHQKRSDELAAEYNRLDAEVKAVEAGIQKRQLCGRRIETLVAALEDAEEDFTMSLWGSMVEKVTVFKDALVFTLTSGEDIRVAPC